MFSKSSTPATCAFRLICIHLPVARRCLRWNVVLLRHLQSLGPQLKHPWCCVAKVLEPQMQPLSSSPTKPQRWRSEHSQDRLECALRKWKLQNISQSSSVVYESTVVIVSPSCLTYWSVMLPSFAALALPTPELPVRKTEFCVVIMRSYQVQAFMEAKAVWTANLLRLSGSKNAKWTPRILIHFQLIALATHGSSVAARLWYWYGFQRSMM